jgi:hypothetical protein
MHAACSVHGEKKRVYKSLVGKPKEKKPLEQTGCRWEDNTNIDPGDAKA